MLYNFCRIHETLRNIPAQATARLIGCGQFSAAGEHRLEGDREAYEEI